MSLDTNVVPGVLTALATLVPAGMQVPPDVVGGGKASATGPLKGISYGTKLSVPVSPWAWVQNASFSTPEPEGSQLITTTWTMLVRLVHKYAPDTVNAERKLAALINPIRTAFRTNTMLTPQPGVNPIRRSYVTGGDWGFMDVNGVWYRYLDLNVAVTEKESLSYS